MPFQYALRVSGHALEAAMASDENGRGRARSKRSTRWNCRLCSLSSRRKRAPAQQIRQGRVTAMQDHSMRGWRAGDGRAGRPVDRA